MLSNVGSYLIRSEKKINPDLLAKTKFIIFLGLIISCNRGSDLKTVFIDEEPPTERSAVIKNFLVDGYKNNRLEWQLKGEKAYINWQEKKVRIFSPFLKHWDEDLKLTRIYGESGDFDEQGDTLYIEKKVRVLSHNGRKLYTDHLYWFEKKKQIITNAGVKILMSNGDIIQGKGMRADMDLNKVTLKETRGEYSATQFE